MTKVLILILLSEIWNVSGQILYKKGANRLGTPNLRSIASYLDFIRRMVRTPVIWLGFFFVSMALPIWIIALAQADLSLVFPIDSMQYIIALIAAKIFLKEEISGMRLAGTLLVLAGVSLVVMSKVYF